MSKMIVRVLASAAMMCGVASAHRISASKSESKFKNYVAVKVGVGRDRFQKFKEGPAYLKKAPKVTAMYHLAIGRNIVPEARGEFDFQWGTMRYKAQSDTGINLSQKIKLAGFTVNGYYDILRHKLISPYITAGAGLGINDAKDLTVGSFSVKGKRTKSFIWNAGVGARMKLGDRFNIDLGYKYMYLGKTRTTTSTPILGMIETDQYVAGTQKIYGNQFLAGVSYYF